MFKSRFQIAGEALVIATLSASAAAQNAQAPINTFTELEAALLACWVPPPAEQSRPGMQITVLMSFNRNGLLLSSLLDERVTHLELCQHFSRRKFQMAYSRTRGELVSRTPGHR